MNGVRILALLLVLAGAIAVLAPAITFTTREKVVDVGPLEIVKEERQAIPMAPVIGGIAIVAGLGLMFAKRKPAL